MSGPERTCARCGHHGFLGGTIGNRHYCHTFDTKSPTCYERQSWDETKRLNTGVIGDDNGRDGLDVMLHALHLKTDQEES